MAKELWIGWEDGHFYDAKPVMDILGNEETEYYAKIELTDQQYLSYKSVCEHYRAWQEIFRPHYEEQIIAGSSG